MKKTFFRSSLSTWIIIILLILFLAMGIYCLIGISGWYNKAISTIFIIIVLFWLFQILWDRISITDEYVYTPSDLLFKFEKIQYETKIYFKDVKVCNVVKSVNDSKNQPIRNLALSSKVQKDYLEFTLKDGSKERICINGYSYSSRLKILELINAKIDKMDNQ